MESHRRECQQLWIQGWKGAEQSRKDGFLANAKSELKWASEVAKLSEPERGERRLTTLESVFVGVKNVVRGPTWPLTQ